MMRHLFFKGILALGLLCGAGTALHAACADYGNENQCSGDSDCIWDDKGTGAANDDECVSRYLPDLCYNEVTYSGKSILGLPLCINLFGIIKGGIGCTQTISILNFNTSQLTDVSVGIDVSGISLTLPLFSDCGIDGSSGNCQYGYHIPLGPLGGLLDRAILFDPMPNYDANTSHTVYTKALVSLAIFSGQNLYGSYLKDGMRYYGKIGPDCTPTGGGYSGIMDSPYHVDAVDSYDAGTYGDANGPDITTKISQEDNKQLTAVLLDENGTVSKYYDGVSVPGGSIQPMPVAFYLADANCTEIAPIYTTNGGDEPLVAYIAQGEETGISIPFEVPEHIIKDGRILMRYLDLYAGYIEAQERCMIQSSTSGNFYGVANCGNSELHLRAAFGNAADNCLDYNGIGYGPCKSQYGTGTALIGGFDLNWGCFQCIVGQQPAVCSADHFAIRPEKFDASLTSGTVLTAGRAYTLEFNATTANGHYAQTYNEVEDDSFTVAVTISGGGKVCAQPDINMTPAVAFADGVDTGNFTFDNIGDVNMTVQEITGSEYALIDTDDTPASARLITPFVVDFRLIPRAFFISAVLRDYNVDRNFTYLHDFNASANGLFTIVGIPYDYNNTMAATLEVNITAVDANTTLPRVTTNYQDTCYAKETNLTLSINATDITPTDAVNRFIYYNPVSAKEGYYVLPSPQTGLTALPIENAEATFPYDQNGSTTIRYKLNFNRDKTKVVNPFRLALTNIRISDTDNVESNASTTTAGGAATYFYARVHAPRYRYDCGSRNTGDDCTKNALIYYEVYKDGTSSFALPAAMGVRAKESVYWYHNTQHTGTDGNISSTQQARSLGQVIDQTSGSHDINASGVTTVPYRYLGQRGYPYKGTIDISASNWLIYNRFDANADTNYFETEYNARGLQRGESNTSHGTEDDAENITNRRIQW